MKPFELPMYSDKEIKIRIYNARKKYDFWYYRVRRLSQLEHTLIRWVYGYMRAEERDRLLFYLPRVKCLRKTHKRLMIKRENDRQRFFDDLNTLFEYYMKP